jgi:hypothetical protein
MSRCYPADDIWYENKNIVEEAITKEIKEFGINKRKETFNINEFTGMVKPNRQHTLQQFGY